MTMGSSIQKWPGLPLFLPVFCAVLVADQISKQIMLDLVFNPPRYIINCFKPESIFWRYIAA